VTRIVVGYDGSPAASAALDVALEEARLRGLPLRIVCAWEIPPLDYEGAPYAPPSDLIEPARQHADATLESAVRSLGDDHGVEIEAEAVPGHPAAVLQDEAAGAMLLVVGTRGLGTAMGVVLGSVSRSLAHHATTPLLIVPAPEDRK
jgi:nucleotide-binding universal stress UspA family protein